MKAQNNKIQPTLNFNLRNFTQKKTPIYAVVRFAANGKIFQQKITTGEKVCPPYWDKKQQLIKDNTTEANKINQKLLTIKVQFLVFLQNNKKFKLSEFEKEISNITGTTKMANPRPTPRKATATKLIEQAFAIYYKGANPNTIVSRQDQLKKIILFFKENGDSVSKINQQGYNQLKEWLLNRGYRRGTINNIIGLFVLLVNNVLRTKKEFSKYDFEHIENKTIAKINIPTSDLQKRPLEKEEINKLFGVKGLPPIMQKFLDVFRVQLLTGQRYSDLPKIFEGGYIVEVIDNIETWKIKTQKEGVTSIIVPNTELKEIVKKYNGVFPVDSKSTHANQPLKKIAKKAGLDKVEKYQVQVGEKLVEETAKTYEIISPHWFRYTFICQKLVEGCNIETLHKMTGHTDTDMIREIYGKIAIEQTKARDVVHGLKEISKTTQTANDNDPNLMELYANLGMKTIELEKLKQKEEIRQKLDEQETKEIQQQREWEMKQAEEWEKDPQKKLEELLKTYPNELDELDKQPVEDWEDHL